MAKKVKSPLASIIPPIINPEDFGGFPAFRETFLVLVTDPQANDTIRSFGKLMQELVLAARSEWPSQPEGTFRADLRAAVADLRQIQGSLLEFTGDSFGPVTKHEAFLAGLGNEIASELGRLADRLEAELGSFRGKV